MYSLHTAFQFPDLHSPSCHSSSPGYLWRTHCVCVCVQICIHHMHVLTHTHTHSHTHTHAQVCERVSECVISHVSLSEQTHTRFSLFLSFTRARARARAHTHTHTYTRTHTHHLDDYVLIRVCVNLQTSPSFPLSVRARAITGRHDPTGSSQ